MSETWYSDVPPPDPKLPAWGYVIFAVRAVLLVATVGVGLILTLILRLVERPLWPNRRPLTGWITVYVCKLALAIIGLRRVVRGTPMRQNGASVANHASWLDVFVLNADAPLYFIAKSEVAGWAGIGWLARATGTEFVVRERKEAANQVRKLRARMNYGHHLLFFPEGTSTDGLDVLPFKPTLFAAFLETGLSIQPVSVRYVAPTGVDKRFYGWWGDMEMLPHLLITLGCWRQGHVEVTYHDPVPISENTERKQLAKTLEATVRSSVVTAG